MAVADRPEDRLLIFSEEGSELILFHVLKDVKGGTYVDVGANDPWDASVTKLFYERGWSGINIEPQKKYHDLLLADRPRDVNLCLGAGNCETELRLWGDGVGATMDGTVADRDDVSGHTTVAVMPLTKILNEHLQPGSEIHFCKIDVEGFEKNVLEGLDLKKYRPWIFVIESFAFGRASFAQWEHMLTDNGYEFVMNFGLDRYYLDRKHDLLRDRFLTVERLLGMYSVRSVQVLRPRLPYTRVKDFIWKVFQKIMNP